MPRAVDHRFHLAAIVLAAAASLYVMTGGARSVDVPQVDAGAARELRGGHAAFIDVRPREAPDTRAIPGAVRIPLEELRARLPSLQLERWKPVVVYCADGKARGPEATRLLSESGFTGAVNLRGGLRARDRAGHPVDDPEG